jgi:hypothetical protein
VSASVWGIDNFNEYLRGSQFTLYADPTPTTDMGTMQTKTLNRLRTAMIKHNFLTKNRQQSNLPKELKMTQNHCKELEQPKNMTFNNKIHTAI